MKKLFSISFVLLFSCFGKAQVNLVTNPSFEQYSQCPDDQAEIDRAVGWFTPSVNTPDYFNACNILSPPFDYSVPHNLCGWAVFGSCSFQYARTGNAYAGFAVLYPSQNGREYVSDSLTDTLTRHKRYDIKFYVSLATGSNCGIKEMGLYLSDTAPNFPANPHNLPLQPQVINSGGSLNDTSNWMLVSGNYLATGGEKYITIGCFLPDSSVSKDSLAPLLSGFNYCYYYVDDVSVTENGGNGMDEILDNNLINLYPNPALNTVTLESKQWLTEGTGNIIDMTGRVIISKEFKDQNRLNFDISNLPHGIYFIELRTMRGVVVKKFSKE